MHFHLAARYGHKGGKIIAPYPNFSRFNDHPTAEVQVGHLDPRKGFNSIVPNRVDAIVTDAR